MIIAIATRYERAQRRKEKLFVKKYFKDIFDKLNITLFPIVSTNNLNKISEICDGLIIPGGVMNINPKYYNEEWMRDKKEVEEYSDYNDTLDFALIKEFSEKGKPILGICRGIQSINVYFGGSLHQNIVGHIIEEGTVEHFVNIGKESFLYSYYNSDRVKVNSYHYQAVKDVAENFKVTAISEDGVIEGIEKGNIIGVQWHPEMNMEYDFFKKFVEIVKKQNSDLKK